MNSIDLIIAAAGKSSRYPGIRPKWQLTAPNGDLMLIAAISGIDCRNIKRIIITVVKEHLTGIKIDRIKERILELKGITPEFIILEDFTSSQSETVVETIKRASLSGAFFIKDCDSQFEITPTIGNYVCVSELKSDTNSINKSYVLSHYNKLLSIIEKRVISNIFSVGGYSFNSADEFIETYNLLKTKEELYISTIVQHMLVHHSFSILNVKHYIDWGTIEDWQKYKKEFKTIFSDIDGCLLTNSGEYFVNEIEPIKENIEALNNLYNNGKTYIILTTARREKYRAETINQLNQFGIKYHKLEMGVLHSGRILINDFAATNPYPTSVAINLPRNSKNLKEYLK